MPNQNRTSFSPSRPAGTARNRCYSERKAKVTYGRTWKSGAGLDPRKKWRNTQSGRPEVDQHRRCCPGECCDDQTVETSGEMEDETCARSALTNGQSLQPLVDHRPRWRKRWQKHTELQGKEVDIIQRILKQRTLEPDEDPEKMSRHLWKTP